MSQPTNDPTEVADRIAIRQLFDEYARCADRREAAQQMALFSVDTRFAVYMDGPGTDPTYVIEGRDALAPIFDDLNQYEATTHFNGQHIVELDGDRATGESYTIAHHLYTRDGTRRVMIAALRYLDHYARIDGRWYFDARDLIVDWTETRESTP